MALLPIVRRRRVPMADIERAVYGEPSGAPKPQQAPAPAPKPAVNPAPAAKEATRPEAPAVIQPAKPQAPAVAKSTPKRVRNTQAGVVGPVTVKTPAGIVPTRNADA